MEKTTGKIIKSQDILCDGQYNLNMEQTNQKPPQNNCPVTGVPKANVIESKNEGAVIKVTCSCGQEISLQCYYENNN
jgi:hypothetical protein